MTELLRDWEDERELGESFQEECRNFVAHHVGNCPETVRRWRQDCTSYLFVDPQMGDGREGLVVVNLPLMFMGETVAENEGFILLPAVAATPFSSRVISGFPITQIQIQENGDFRFAEEGGGPRIPRRYLERGVVVVPAGNKEEWRVERIQLRSDAKIVRFIQSVLPMG